jgi:hypothetical protein
LVTQAPTDHTERMTSTERPRTASPHAPPTSLWSRFRAWSWRTLVSGFFFLLPLGVLLFLAFQVWKLLRKKIYVMVDVWGVSPDLRVGVALLVALVFLTLVSLAAGVLIDLGFGGTRMGALDRYVQRVLPGYGMMRMRMAEHAGLKSMRRPALLRTSYGLQPVFIMERDAGRVLVFVPYAPDSSKGKLMVVSPDIVEDLDIGVKELDDLFPMLGRGLLAYMPPSKLP